MHQPLRLEPHVSQYSGIPVEVLASITRRLDEINTIRRNLDDEEFSLKARRNAVVPFNRLPNEIMVTLLLLYEPDWDGRPRVPPEVAWIRVASVCRYWYSVACATPLLWSTIEASKKNVAWLDLCLSRSVTASLRLTLRSPSDQLLSQVASQSRRIEHLKVLGVWNPLSLSFLREPMPLLESLELAAGNPEDAPNFFDFDMSPRNYPRLRVLDIHSIDSIPQNIQLYAGLRQLSLSACPLDITLDQFYDILSACTRLKTLICNDFFGGLSDQGWTSRLEPGPWRPIISLPHLNTLLFEDEFQHDVSQFLAHLVLSPSASFAIHGVFRPRVEDVRMSASLPANRTTTLPVLSTITYVILHMDWSEYVIRASKNAAMQDEIAVLGLASDDGGEWEDYLARGLFDLVEIFQGAPLTRLSIAGYYDDIEDPDDWRTVFAAFPKLEVLECYANESSSTTLLWWALSLDDTPQEVTCPQLRSITIRSREEATSFFEEMLACLRSRVMPGGGRDGKRLQKLDLEVQSRGWESNECLRRSYIPRLRQLVDDVRLQFIS